MNPSLRVLKIMEYLMAAGQRPVKQVQISKDLNLAPATVNRIVKSLADEGYLLITSEKYCVRNFRLSRNVPMSNSYLAVLNQLMENISSEAGVSVEAVVVTGFELFWHSCTEFPDASIAIKAKPGFRRTLSELDPMARLYLSRIPWDDIDGALRPSGFFRNDIHRNLIDADEARKVIEGSADKLVDFDFEGNHLGVRRFATVVDDDQGSFVHLLSIAEPAIPVKNREAHIAKQTNLLNEARSRLKRYISMETKKEFALNDQVLPASVA